MATYPSFEQLASSTEKFIDDVQIDRAANGAVKARAFYSQRMRAWQLKHLLTSAQLTGTGSLLEFYDANRLTTNTFTWERDNTSYTFQFDGPPQYDIVRPGGSAGRLYMVTVEMVQR